MAASGHHIHNLVPMDTLITIKITVNDNLKKLKLPLRDLTANVLPDKVRETLKGAMLHLWLWHASTVQRMQCCALY